MAFSDYHACDNCGQSKTFYDANMDIEWSAEAESWLYQGYRVFALCHICSEDYELRVCPKIDQPNSGDR